MNVGTVDFASMPQGVEHPENLGGGTNETVVVDFASMPQGVEHVAETRESRPIR